MAFKLTKAEDTRKASIEANLEEVVGKVEDAKNQLEADIAALVETFNAEAVTILNEALEDARGFVEDIHRERSEEYDMKSERWMEGERGQAAYDWLQSWETAVGELDEVAELDAPTIEFEIPDAASVVQQLEGEPAQ
jgi:Rad3-related DNA helicase